MKDKFLGGFRRISSGYTIRRKHFPKRGSKWTFWGGIQRGWGVAWGLWNKRIKYRWWSYPRYVIGLRFHNNKHVLESRNNILSHKKWGFFLTNQIERFTWIAKSFLVGVGMVMIQCGKLNQTGNMIQFEKPNWFIVCKPVVASVNWFRIWFKPVQH